ncbi:putative hydroxymethylpyrimidine transport system substrate-binding protein [Rhodoligotrophos appendicifer]|uniref:ABC transporter substrate-binding protein n=1 Tax=Rhodoligotrophos appendicifer TaxID=987056 RepID=UPI001AEF0AC1|nr:ABC transporter substrate-binding protein [Rhodoligotrophos appendicifer]
MNKRAFLVACLMLPLFLSAPTQAAEKLTVLLEWFVNPDHAPLVVADRLGLFKAAGLEVELIAPSDPSAVPRLVAAGQADIGIHYQPNLYLDNQAGVDLVRFGTLVETPLNSITVLADGPIRSLADLKGKSIGYSVSGFEQTLLEQMLASGGLSLDDVQLVNVNFALTASLIGGKVDATIGGFRNFELTQMKLEGHQGKSFYPEDHGVPAYDELILVTRPELVADNRLPRFLEALEKGALYLTNHPDEAWKLFIAAYPALDDALNKQAWADTLPRFAKRPAALDHSRYRRFADFLVKRGLLKKAPELSEIAVELP